MPPAKQRRRWVRPLDMGGRRSPLDPRLPHQAQLSGDLGVSEEDEELEGFMREAAILRAKLREALR